MDELPATTYPEAEALPALPAGRRRGIGLCLSGGGFRAALFHLGAVRRLHELGVLEELRTISSVSGGSIFSAFLADRLVRDGKIHDWDAQVAVPFRRFVGRDLRTLLVLLHLPWNWLVPGVRARHFERQYGKRLTSLRLDQLPETPEFVFCATDLVFGVNWTFRRNQAGSYQSGSARDAGEWPIARAVAASSCFPPVFGPLPIAKPPRGYERGAYGGADRERLLGRMALSDGGLYDNLAQEPVWKNHETVLVSDCGAPFSFGSGGLALRRIMRYVAVSSNQSLSLRKRMFFAAIRENHYAGTYWGIESAADPLAGGYPDALVHGVIANIRTDLDTFTEAETAVLENHGYLVCDAAMRSNLPALLPDPVPPTRVPGPEWMDAERVRHALRSSHRRFSLGRISGRVFERVRGTT